MEVLFVGQFTELFRGMNAALTEKYEVKACVNRPEIFKGMMKLAHPSLVIILKENKDENGDRILEFMKTEYPDIPVVTAGEDIKTVEAFMALVETAVAAKDEKPAADEEQKAETEDNRKSILMIDDSGVFLRTLKGLIGDGYHIQTATSGLNVMPLIRERRPDLIFLDYEMPLFDGRQTLLKLRESEESRDIPVVFVTAVNEREHIKAVLELKPAGYLLKPVEKERVLQTIHSILGE